MNRAIAQYQRLIQTPLSRNRLLLVGGSIALVGCAALLSSVLARRSSLFRATFAHPSSTARTVGQEMSATHLKEVSPSKELYEKLPAYTVIDVREPHERIETGFVPSSVNIPLAGVLDGTAPIPDQKKPYLIVCRSGARSKRAADALLARGMDVTNLASGTMGWIVGGLQVDHESQGMKEVSPSQDLLSKLPTYIVIDVREPHERVETGFVPTSINIPLAGVLDGTAKIPDQTKPFLMVCRSGARSKKASEALLARGMDVTNLVSGTLGWIAAGLPVSRETLPEKEEKPSTDLLKRLPQYTVIDVREPHERVETGYVPSSLNVPLAGVLDGTAVIPSQKKPYLLVCRSGARSKRACDALAPRGYDVTNLASGTLGWIAAGLPVEKDK